MGFLSTRAHPSGGGGSGSDGGRLAQCFHPFTGKQKSRSLAAFDCFLYFTSERELLDFFLVFELSRVLHGGCRRAGNRVPLMAVGARVVHGVEPDLKIVA